MHAGSRGVDKSIALQLLHVAKKRRKYGNNKDHRKLAKQAMENL